MNVVFTKRVFTNGPDGGRVPAPPSESGPVALNAMLVATCQPNATGEGTFVRFGGDGPAVLVCERFEEVVLDLDLARLGRLPIDLAHDPERRTRLRAEERRGFGASSPRAA